MRVLLLVVCALAVSTASVIPFGGSYNDGGVFKYEGPQHIPVITKEGVPEDTLEVQHASAEHFAALSAEDVKGYSGYSIKQEHYPTVMYHGPEHIPVITKEGVPEDTLEVQHARAEHLAAISAADLKGFNGYTVKQEHYPTVKYHGPEHIPVITKEGVPEDTLEVQHARTEHLAAISAADLKGFNGYTVKQEHYPTVKYHGPEHIPVITKQGVPTETSEVQYAKANHLAAHAAAAHKIHRYRRSLLQSIPEDTLEVKLAKAEHFEAVAAAKFNGFNGYTIKQEHYPTVRYHGPEHIPVITKEGVPEDTLEVQHARAEHFAALSAEDVKRYSGYSIKQEHYPTVKYHGPEHIPVITKEGVPEDTLEVQHARAEHLAALSAEDVKGYNGYTIKQEHYPTVKYHGPEHIPVITKEGVPEDTLEVQHARAEHLAALSAEDVKGYNGYTIKQEHYPTVKYHGPEYIPVITKEGVPEDTLEVQHARAEHLAALSAEDVKGYNGYTIKQEHYPTVKYHGPEHMPVITKEGVPEDTLEVKHARAEHFSALSAEKLGFSGYSIKQDHYPVMYHGPKHITVITKEGVPEETEEVKLAKSEHFAALSAESSKHSIHRRSIYHQQSVPEDTLEVKQAKAEHFAAHAAAEVKGFSGYSIKQEHYPNMKYHGPQHIPVITKEGVPEETAEVKQAKSEHLAALSANNHITEYAIHQEHYPTIQYQGAQHIPVITKEGVPEETAEVKELKAQHFAALSAVDQQYTPVYSYNLEDIHELPVIAHNDIPVDTDEVQHAKSARFAAIQAADARDDHTKLQYSHHF